MLPFIILAALFAAPVAAATASDRRRSSARSDEDDDNESSSNFSNLKFDYKPVSLPTPSFTKIEPLHLTSFASRDESEDERFPWLKHKTSKFETITFPKPFKLHSICSTTDEDKSDQVSDGGFYYRDWREKQSREREDERRHFDLTIKHNQEIAIAPYRSYPHIGEGDFKNAAYRKASEWYQPSPIGHTPLPWAK